MATEYQKKQLLIKLKEYKKRYLKKQYFELDEAATRLMVNSFLSDVLGYKELDEIKTEYRIKGEYADYVIQLARKKHFVVEAKTIQLDLSEKHLRQSVNYAANEGIDWILLMNGRQIELYRLIFGKPIRTKKIFSFNLVEQKELVASVEFLSYLTKTSVLKKDLEGFWQRFQALEPSNISKSLYSIEVVRFLKKTLRQKVGVAFSEDDIFDAIHQVVTTKIDIIKPKSPIMPRKKPKKQEDSITHSKEENGTKRIVSS